MACELYTRPDEVAMARYPLTTTRDVEYYPAHVNSSRTASSISISSRVGHGPRIWICKCDRARCVECKSEFASDGALNLAFYGFRPHRFRYVGIRAREYDVTENILRIFFFTPSHDNFYTVTFAPLIDGGNRDTFFI